MKLRIRSLESKETHKIEVTNTCNLQQLKQVITLHLFPSSSSSSSVVQGNLLLSLNRKDELCGSSPEDTLQSLGVTSGDLIYYTRNPFAFSSQNPNLLPTQMESSLEINHFSFNNHDLINSQKIESGKRAELIDPSEQTRELDTPIEGSSILSNPNDRTRDLMNTQKLESDNSVELTGSSARTQESMDTQEEESLKLSNPSDHTGNLVNVQKDEPLEIKTQVEKSIEETEEGDEMDVDDESELSSTTKFSVPSFLKRVFVKEVGDVANGGNHKLLVIAVHAVLLESGFVSYDPVAGMKVDGFHLADEWPSSAFSMSLHYALPEGFSSEMVQTVVLKFQTMGKFVNIYGSLPRKGFGVHRLCLDETRFVPALNFVWNKSDYADLDKESVKFHPNREIFEFWKIVKDELSYPLLIDLCEEMGLIPPPCFMRLPTELKLKILESLPAVDVARVECVCSELRFIASNNDLWRLKYEEEFGNCASAQRETQWKANFYSAWEMRKKRKRVRMTVGWRQPPLFRPLFPGRRDPNPPGYPFIIGGDHDIFPLFGAHQLHGRTMFRSNCDLGGFRS